ncbi:DUF1189 domain-containing protein [Vallitalea sp.]|jgi:hypothetical protein|uniref:DUF1189 domain-containing protein n=1 Tax=Vallitalea sp. TaxID=1882829 RepID=UPI0025F90BC1|nr:DUF1189 domain-containing protein [Vallitalea sp.]MCT4685855.1 DUF1189 domain-containing protein [Vallitalea sp.]
MENIKSPNIFVKFIKSFTDFRVYTSIRHERLGKSFGYLILLALFIGITLSIIVSVKTNTSIDNTIELLQSDDMPEITVSNGILNIDMNEPLVLTKKHDFIFIVDMTDKYTLNDLVGYSMGYLVTPERIIINQAGSPPMPLEFKDLRDFNIDKKSVLEILTSFRGLAIGFIVFLIIAGTVLLKLFESLMVSIIGLIASSVLKTNLSYNELYKIGIYALTLPAIIMLLINSFGLAVALGFKLIIYYGISTIIVVMALKNISKDNNSDTLIDDSNKYDNY